MRTPIDKQRGGQVRRPRQRLGAAAALPLVRHGLVLRARAGGFEGFRNVLYGSHLQALSPSSSRRFCGAGRASPG